MAGAGYRTWTAGEVVTASNVQSYLQDQTVGVYAGTAARSSAILSPSEGQVSYRTDDDIVEVYDGSAWTPVAPTDSGLIHINTTTYSAVASQSLDDVFSSTYDDYKIIIEGVSSADDGLFLRFRAGGVTDTTDTVNTQKLSANTSSVTTARTSTTRGEVGSWRNAGRNSAFLELSNPFLILSTRVISQVSNATSGSVLNHLAIGTTATTSYDGILIFPNSGTITGRISIYGYAKA
jgi:hypothetical protein